MYIEKAKHNESNYLNTRQKQTVSQNEMPDNQRTLKFTGIKEKKRKFIQNGLADIRVVQRITKEDLNERKSAIQKLIGSGLIPEEGTNMWRLQNEAVGTEIHLLGTVHTNKLGELKHGKTIFEILKGMKYNQIYSELEMDVSGIQIDDSMGEDIAFNREHSGGFLKDGSLRNPGDVMRAIKKEDKKRVLAEYTQFARFLQEGKEGRLRQGIIDEMYIAIASNYSGLEKNRLG